ncbi:MAG: hypothetical protein IIY49_10410 [Eubacterium sp.]|jgi:hypothetical protein|nr:hypothetical protein [Eubacterium sp.]
MIHPSHFFEPVEGFIRTHPGVCQVAVLNQLALNAGCPTEDVDSIVNGVLSDLLQISIAPQNKNLSVINPIGLQEPDTRINPTIDELVEILIKQFEGITKERASKLIDFLINKGVFECDPTSGMLFLKTRLRNRLPISLS